jgi:hypothetical protein
MILTREHAENSSAFMKNPEAKAAAAILKNEPDILLSGKEEEFH